MKCLITLLSFFLITSVWSGKEISRRSYHVVQSSEPFDQLDDGCALFTFQLAEHNHGLTKQLEYSIDGEVSTVRLDRKHRFRQLVDPGKHSFQVAINDRYYEIFIHDLAIKNGHHTTIELHFFKAEQRRQLKKPVIYLYPEDTTQLNVSLNTDAELTFTYPNYPETGWDITAYPDGTLLSNNYFLNYLFWEGELNIPERYSSINEGSIVENTKLLAFLEETLIQYGMTSAERQDFITYWYPYLNKHSNLYIYFLFDEACDEFATLNISPEPAEVARIYMLWAPVEPNYEHSGIAPQEIPQMRREGFTVLEWGGAEIIRNDSRIN